MSSMHAVSQSGSSSTCSRGRPSLDGQRGPTVSSGGSSGQASMTVGSSGDGGRASEGHKQSKLRMASSGPVDPGSSSRGAHEDVDGPEGAKAAK